MKRECKKKNLENKSTEQIAKIEERVKGNITKKVTKQQSKKIVKKAKQKAKQKAKKAKQKAKKAAKLAKKKAKRKRRQKVAGGATTKWKEIFTKKSGTYTFDANSISLTASTGSGSGTIDADSTINFGNKTIAVTYVGTDILLGTDANDKRNFSKTRTRNYGGSSGNNDYVDSDGYLRETMNFNLRSNGNTHTNKVRQRGGDTLQSLTELTNKDVNEKWDPNETNWYFVNTNFQGTNGSGGAARNVANQGTFSVAIENWDKDTEAISNKIEGSATVAKD